MKKIFLYYFLLLFGTFSSFNETFNTLKSWEQKLDLLREKWAMEPMQNEKLNLKNNENRI